MRNVRPNVYTYYEVVPGLWSEDSQRKLIEIWKKSWRNHGWNPIVLNEKFVSTHPRYRFFKEHFWALPTEYGHDYEGACFLRWLAVAHAGGGMMTDYDVINYGFKPRDVSQSTMTLFTDGPPVSMGAVLGCKQHFLDMCELFAAWVPDDEDINRGSKTYNGHHCSDMTYFIRMFDKKTKPKPEWLVKEGGIATFPNPGWDKSPLTHYCYAMHAAGYWPKHLWIEKIRPL